MKIPAVAIAAAFASGILLGRMGSLSSFLLARGVLVGCFATILFLLVSSLLLAARGRVWPAALLSLTSWCGLGAVAIGIASRPLPPEHVLARLAAGQMELKTPLRWYGTLRDEPARLPWGYRMDLELSAVERTEGFVPVRGGMRVNFTPRGDDAALPEVHAGDEVSVLTQGRLPQVFRDEGAFDRRAYLAQQNVHLVATLRASTLLERIALAKPTMGTRLARLRAQLREKLNELYPDTPRTAWILRAMLLGDRSFVDREESTDFQKTGVFHVLVVGLHVGALAFFVFWVERKLRLPRVLATLILLGTLLAYVAVVEQRAPVLRAGLMAAIVVLASFFYRRLEVLNSAALAALILLVAKPVELFDTSFQFSFLAIGCVAEIALPWLERHVQPYVQALSGWRDVTRDGTFSPQQVQFRMDLRDVVALATNSCSTDGEEMGRTELEHRDHGKNTEKRKIRVDQRVDSDGIAVGAAGCGTGGGVGSATGGDAADDGEGVSSGDVAGAGGEFSRGAVDRSDCATGIFEARKRNDLDARGAGACETVGMAGGGAEPCGGVLRGDGAWELPDSRAAVVGDCGVLYLRSDGSCVFEIGTGKAAMALAVDDWGRAGGDGRDCDASLPRSRRPRGFGSGGVGCGARGFDSCDFAEGEHAAD